MEWLNGGLLPEKLVVGMPTYGRGYEMSVADESRIYCQADRPNPAGPYVTYVKPELILSYRPSLLPGTRANADISDIMKLFNCSITTHYLIYPSQHPWHGKSMSMIATRRLTSLITCTGLAMTIQIQLRRKQNSLRLSVPKAPWCGPLRRMTLKVLTARFIP